MNVLVWTTPVFVGDFLNGSFVVGNLVIRISYLSGLPCKLAQINNYTSFQTELLGIVEINCKLQQFNCKNSKYTKLINKVLN